MGKSKTRQEFVDELQSKGRSDIMLLGDYINNKTKTLFKCTKYECGHQWLAAPSNILRGMGCPVCANLVVIPAVNSVYVLDPDVVKYFENPDDALKLTPSSSKKVNLVCQDCGSKRTMIMGHLHRDGFNCHICGPNISYPNRFLRSFMNQVKGSMDFVQYEWSQKWTQGLLYDAYFKVGNNQYTIEMQGRQHFVPVWDKSMTVEDLAQKDSEKANLVIERGITPIIIDASISDADFIITNIYNSKLSKVFDLSKVDWEQCKIDATKNIVKEICTYYSNNNSTIEDIAKTYKFDRQTIRKYLKMGSNFGWCDYVSKMKKPSIPKKVNVFSDNHDLIYSYNSMKKCATELSKMYGNTFNASSIRSACKSHKIYHNLFFEFAN